MGSKLVAGGLTVAVAFLLATNPIVADAAGQITGKQIKNNSVTGKDIKDGKLSGVDVGDGSLEGKDLRDGTVAGVDLGDGSVSGPKVADGAVNTAKVADGSLTGGDLLDGSLTGADLPIRVAIASSTGSAVSGTTAATPALTTTITAPSRGYLVTTASSDVYGDAVESLCWIAVDSVEISASERVLANTTGVEEDDCSTNVAVAVEPGNHTVQLVASPGSSSVIFDEAALQVLFVPFGATGTLPTTVPPLTRGDGGRAN